MQYTIQTFNSVTNKCQDILISVRLITNMDQKVILLFPPAKVLITSIGGKGESIQSEEKIYEKHSNHLLNFNFFFQRI